MDGIPTIRDTWEDRTDMWRTTLEGGWTNRTVGIGTCRPVVGVFSRALLSSKRRIHTLDFNFFIGDVPTLIEHSKSRRLRMKLVLLWAGWRARWYSFTTNRQTCSGPSLIKCLMAELCRGSPLRNVPIPRCHRWLVVENGGTQPSFPGRLINC